MKRSGPLRSKTPLRSKAGLETRTPMRQRSKKRERLMATERGPLVKRLRDEGVRCEIGHVLAAAGVTPFRCSGEVEGIHERRKRSSAGSLTVAENLIPACNWCNGWVEDHPSEAREVAGDWLVLRPGDDGYDDLGARAEGAPVEVERCSVCGLPFVTRGPERGVLVAPCGH